MSGSNQPLASPPIGLALEYAHWKGWWWKVWGRVAPTKRQRMVAWAKRGLAFHGRMHYCEDLPPAVPNRTQLFHRPRGQFLGAHADCSQYAATVAKWSGVKDVDDADYTGTLGRKGAQLPGPIPGCFVFFGPFPHVHMGVMVNNTTLAGFGVQTGPDLNTVAGMQAYFAGQGVHGIEYRDITRA